MRLYNEQINEIKRLAQNGEIDFVTACEKAEKAIESYLEEHGERPPALLSSHFDSTRKPSLYRERVYTITTLEEIGNLLDTLAQKEEQEREREEAKKRDRIDWLKLEQEKESQKHMTYKKLVRELERYTDLGIITKERAEEIKKEFKVCDYYKCDNVIYIGDGYRTNAKYCSHLCSVKMRAARVRMRRTGTLLTQDEYLSRLDSTQERHYKKHEFPVENIDRIPPQKNYHQAMHEMRVNELIELNKRQPVKVYKIGGGDHLG